MRKIWIRKIGGGRSLMRTSLCTVFPACRVFAGNFAENSYFGLNYVTYYLDKTMTCEENSLNIQAGNIFQPAGK